MLKEKEKQEKGSAAGEEEELPAGEESLATSLKHLELCNTADELYRRNAE